jgi:virginiamycin B lyase
MQDFPGGTMARILIALLLWPSLGLPLGAQSAFRRGDINADGSIDISDPVALLLHLFAGNPAPPCLAAGDADASASLDTTDAVLLLRHLFTAGAPPAAPYPDCGLETSLPGLGCAAHLPCAEDGDPAITEWTVPWSGSRPRDPYVGATGRVWFVGQNADYAAYLEPESGEFRRFALPAGAGPHNLIVGTDVWYAGNGDAHIGKLDPTTGEIDVLEMPDPAAQDPHTLVFDQQGDIWFTVQQGNFVGKVTVATGEIRLIEVPTPDARPYGIIVDAENRPWFVEFGTNKLASIDREAFTIEEHRLPRSGARPRRIGVTSDGAIWYVDYAQGYLGRFTPSTRTFKEWRAPGGSGADPYGMAVDHRDRIWFVETGPNPNRFVGFNPATEQFFSRVEIPSNGDAVRHMYFHAPTREIWFGTDAGTIGRARVE